MEKYPLIKIRKGKIMKDNEIIKNDVIEFIEKLAKENGMVYAIDLDGYKKNSANFKIYKDVAGYLWIDAYPRYVEDVMDIVITGAKRITIRNMDEEKLNEIKEMVESQIYLSANAASTAAAQAKKFGFKGVVLEESQNIKDEIETWKIYLDDYVIRRIK